MKLLSKKWRKPLFRQPEDGRTASVRSSLSTGPFLDTTHKAATFSEANEMIDRYIHFYNHERIQLKTGEAPLARRLPIKASYFPT